MAADDPYPQLHHVVRETRPPDRMHQHDPHLAGLVFEYVRTRLTFTDTPLDHPTPPEPIMAALDGFIDEYGRDPREVLDAYVEPHRLQRAFHRQPTLLRLHPRRAHQGGVAVRHRGLHRVAAGCSWLEASGAIVAGESGAALDRRSGRDARHGGWDVRVRGSAANLSALAVAREIGRQRFGGRCGSPAAMTRTRRWPTPAASSMSSRSWWPPRTIASTGDALKAALDSSTRAPVVAVVATSGTTNAGIVDDLEGIAHGVPGPRSVDASTALHGGAALLSDLSGWRFAGPRARRLFITDPHKWWFAPFRLRRGALP